MFTTVSIGLSVFGALLSVITWEFVRPKPVKALLLVIGLSSLAVGVALLLDLLTVSF